MHAAAIVGRHCQQMRLIEWTELNCIGERKERESKKANNARLGPPIGLQDTLSHCRPRNAIGFHSGFDPTDI